MTIGAGKPFLGSRCSDVGCSWQELRTALREGAVRRVLRDVYVDDSVPDSREIRCAALHLVMPDSAVLCGTTAAWAMGIDAFQPEDRFLLEPGCVVPHHTTRCTVRGVRTIEGYITPADVMDLDGLRVTTPLRTTIDLLRRLRRPFALSAADAMAHARLVRREELVERLPGLKGYPGIVQARSLAVVVDARIEAAGESWLRLRLHDAGLPRPEPQYDVVDVKGRHRGRLDFAYPHARIGCEYDGREVHTLAEDVDHDRLRRAYLTDVLGWRIFVVTKGDVLGRDDWLERQVADLLSAPAALPREW